MNRISHYCHLIVRSIIFYILTLTIIIPAHSSGDIMVRGRLINDPCTLMTDDENVIVDFDVIVDKYLYLNRNTLPRSFQIRLVDCQVDPDSGVSVSFNGIENSSLQGYLNLDAASVATNVAVGILDSNGVLIPINSTTSVVPITDTNITLDFQAIIEAEPQAIRDRTIGLGTFVATATFVLNYE